MRIQDEQQPVKEHDKPGWWLSASAYAALTEHASILEQVGDQVKVLLLHDQRVVKLFQIRARFSSALVYPYSFRFFRNARKLKSLGVPSVRVEQTFFCPSLRCHGVIYELLAGEALHNLDLDTDVWRRFAGFIAELHAKGVYFRSLHLGNVVLMPDAEFGLIDIADMRFKRPPLPDRLRVRNFKHLFRLAAHRRRFAEIGVETFLDDYLDACRCTGEHRAGMKRKLVQLYAELCRSD
jgi:hypothetical protein